MKNLFILVFLFLIIGISKNGYSQKVYRDLNEYNEASKIYNDKWISYENYTKKLNFYANFKYRKGTYPKTNDDWINYVKPKMENDGIYFDNHVMRLRPSVDPDGIVFVNFFESSTSNYLVVTCTEKEPDPTDSKLVYYATMYKFNHPGKPPVYVKPSKITPMKKINVDSVTTFQDTIQNQPIPVTNYTITYAETLKENERVHEGKFLMPDGNRYTYDELLILYPSMKENTVFVYNFKK